MKMTPQIFTKMISAQEKEKAKTEKLQADYAELETKYNELIIDYDDLVVGYLVLSEETADLSRRVAALEPQDSMNAQL